ncbi:thioesterase II family protein [Paenibacillus aquistagni]|uniref:thioesterase II family protein n=1 Tax=Paenibacillus aquistagni TaxID=1852522 RepID=UPI000B50E278|nr:thioesterase domain-containing protein [Paenibacillus aquistagni]NMM55489.1 thioesterase [Paenibacillus aquistagni]
MGIIFCIPYAGGSASIFNQWKNKALPGWKVVPVELSGKGSRFAEGPYENMEIAVVDIYKRVVDALSEDYIIYGHSMGALIAYELVQKIRFYDGPPPKHIVFSGCVPPDKFQLTGIDLTSDSEIKQRLLSLGGTPPQIIKNTDLASVFLPIIRADYQLLQRYIFDKTAPLTEDISIFYGKNDNTVSLNDLMTWDAMTTGKTEYYEFEGNHFFLNDESNKVIDCLNEICTNFRFDSSQLNP